MDQKILSLIIGVCLVLIIGLIVFLRYKLSPKEEDKKAAMDFLLQLKDELYETIIKIIVDFDYTTYPSLVDMEIDITNKIIEACRKCINEELANSKDMLSVLMLKCLNSDMIEKFIESIIAEFNVKSLIDNKIFEMASTRCNIIEKEDKELEEKFSDEELYNDSEIKDSELEEAEEVEVPEEELDKLNPQVDDEEEFNSEDESMEIVDDDIYYDAAGRARSKKTGKWIKVD